MAYLGLVRGGLRETRPVRGLISAFDRTLDKACGLPGIGHAAINSLRDSMMRAEDPETVRLRAQRYMRAVNAVDRWERHWWKEGVLDATSRLGSESRRGVPTVRLGGLATMGLGMPVGGVGARLSKVLKQALPQANGLTLPRNNREIALKMGLPLSGVFYNSTERARAIAQAIYGIEGSFQSVDYLRLLFGNDYPITSTHIADSLYRSSDSGAFYALVDRVIEKMGENANFTWIPGDHNLSASAIRRILEAGINNPGELFEGVIRMPVDGLEEFGLLELKEDGQSFKAAVEKSKQLLGINTVNTFNLTGPAKLLYDVIKVRSANGTLSDSLRNGLVKTLYTPLFETRIVRPIWFGQEEWADDGNAEQLLADTIENLRFGRITPHDKLHRIAPNVYVVQTGDKLNSNFVRDMKSAIKEGRIKGTVVISDDANVNEADMIETSLIIGPVKLKGKIRESYVYQVPNSGSQTIWNINRSFVIPGTTSIGDLTGMQYEGPLRISKAGIAAIRATEATGNKDVDKDLARLESTLCRPLKSGLSTLIAQKGTPVFVVSDDARDAKVFGNDDTVMTSIPRVKGREIELVETPGLRPGFTHVSLLSPSNALRDLQKLLTGVIEPAPLLAGAIGKLSVDRYLRTPGIDGTTMPLIPVRVADADAPTVAEKQLANAVMQRAFERIGKAPLVVYFSPVVGTAAPKIRHISSDRRFDPNQNTIGNPAIPVDTTGDTEFAKQQRMNETLNDWLRELNDANQSK